MKRSFWRVGLSWRFLLCRGDSANGVTAGLTKRSRENLYDPEAKCDLRDIGFKDLDSEQIGSSQSKGQSHRPIRDWHTGRRTTNHAASGFWQWQLIAR